MLQRKNIIAYLVKHFQNNNHVFAIWLEGSDTTNATDEHSDIDIWFDVTDGFELEIISEAKNALLLLDNIDFEYHNPQNHPQIWHSIFHLENTPKTLVIDFMVQSHNRKYVFTEKEELVKVLFDRDNSIQFKPFDFEKQQVRFKKRLKELDEMYFFLITSYVEKNILRGNFIDSLYYYKRYALEPLIELARMKYCPFKMKYGYNFKNLYKDLPKEIAKNIEDLYKVKNVEEIDQNLIKAKELFTIYIEKAKEI